MCELGWMITAGFLLLLDNNFTEPQINDVLFWANGIIVYYTHNYDWGTDIKIYIKARWPFAPTAAGELSILYIKILYLSFSSVTPSKLSCSAATAAATIGSSPPLEPAWIDPRPFTKRDAGRLPRPRLKVNNKR